MRRVLAWLRHGMRLHADVTSGRYALRRKNEALTAALAECRAERDAATISPDALDAAINALEALAIDRREPLRYREWYAAALGTFRGARPAQPREGGTDA